MLYEDDVVEAVRRFLATTGWSIESVALATQHGDDLTATRAGRRLSIEAKGEGSSMSHTKRYGSSFNRGQVASHVAVAVTRALAVVSQGDSIAGVAFPWNEFHRDRVALIAPALARLGVVVFWVSSDLSVEVQGEL